MIEVTKSMTAADLRQACVDLAASIGGKADVTISTLSQHHNRSKPASIVVWPNGFCDSGRQSFDADTYPEAFANARQWADQNKVVRHNALIRNMAVAIMVLTDEHGHCTDTLLRGKGFSAAEITEHHEAACQRAGEMAGNTPFSVEMTTVAA